MYKIYFYKDKLIFQAKSRQRKTEVWTEDKLKERLFLMFDENDTILYEELKEKTNAPKVFIEKLFKNLTKFRRAPWINA